MPRRVGSEEGLVGYFALWRHSACRSDFDLNVESFAPGEDRNQHQVLANWTARVSGGHWGHLHRQTVSYRGLLDVSRHGDLWMLDDLTIISAKTGG